MLRWKIHGYASLLVGMIAIAAQGAVIDFETTPGGGLPVDDAELSVPYNIGGTLVTFGSDTTGDGAIDAYARFEDYFVTGSGEKSNTSSTAAELLHGFTHGSHPYVADSDRTASAQGMTDGLGGKFMIRVQKDADDGGAAPGTDLNTDPFLIVYDGVLPVSASGQLWDIDGAAGGKNMYTEQYQIDALDSADVVMDTLITPIGLPYNNPATLSGLPWVFSFDSLPRGIKTIRITKLTVGPQRGFGFDNFNATEPTKPSPDIPEPTTAVLVTLGMCACLMRPGRRRRVS